MIISVFKPTNDEWYPSFKIDGWYDGIKNQALVEVTFTGQLSDGTWRVCAWGADDHGMELDQETEGHALTTFMQVIGMNYVNIKDLITLGFISA
jgi:hypothetical protein